MSPDDPVITLRIGDALITPLRPYEAAIRSQLMLHERGMDWLRACADLRARSGALERERP